MALILSIETATNVCSVALARNGKLLPGALKETNEDKSHAKLLSVFIDEILKQQNLTPNQLDAVAISGGPGSYTGLRIGTATAKGLTYALDIPLIAVNTLAAMASGFAAQNSFTQGELLCPMIDARRMEVYTALHTPTGELVKPTEAKVIDEKSFANELLESKIHFFGNGAEKCKESIISENAVFTEDFLPSASFLIPLAQKKFKDKDFEDTAYYEPAYLKDFIPTTPKKKFF